MVSAEHIRCPKNLLISPGYADCVDIRSDAIAMTCKQFGHLLLRDRRGATAIEYGLIVSLIVIVMLGALKGVANANTSMWNNVAQKVVGDEKSPEE
jgi:pilus assembly protein Flp/PilA